jgi:hypothetical protein
VSSLGRVQSLDRIVKRGNAGSYHVKARVLAAYTHRGGYQSVALCREGIRHKVYTHVLVKQAFG